LGSLELPAEPSRRYLSLRDLRNVVLFALAYLAAYGYGSLFAQNASAPIWIPDSVLLCALLLTSREKWWLYIVIAAPIRFLPGVRPHVPQWFLWATFVNDALKAMLAAALLRYTTGNPIRFNTIRKCAVYLGIAVFLVPVLSASWGTAARHALGYAFWPGFSQWFLGNALANIVVTPTLLLWFAGEYRYLRARATEVTIWVIGFALCLTYTILLTRFNESPFALYAPIPFLLWAAARFGAIGTSTGLSLTTLFLLLGVSQVNGPFSGYPAMQYIQFVQLFLGIISLPILFVAILFEEQQTVEERLRENERELKKNDERNRDLAGRLIRAQEEERKRIARELHDDIGQQIALLAIGLDHLAGSSPSKAAPEQSQLSELKRRTEDVAASVRDVAHQLHSATLQHLGIVRGLEGLCKTFSQQHHIEVNLEAAPRCDLSDQLSLCLFRVVQEALNNATKHGHASQIGVTLAKKAGSLHLQISDTGIGFDPAAASEGLGLVSMRERLRMVGGSLTVKSSRGHGTVIEAVVEDAARKSA